MDQNYLDQGTNLSAEVEPFIPRSDTGNVYAEPLINQPSSGQLPHYLTSCYPFVQDHNTSESNPRVNQGNSFFHNRDMNVWPVRPPAANSAFPPQVPPRFGNPTAQGPPPNFPIPSAHPAPLYSYHTRPTTFLPHQFQGLNQSPFSQQMYMESQSHESPLYQPGKKQYRREQSGRKPHGESKKSANKKPGRRSVGIQMETGNRESHENDVSSMIDNSQQTDFPSEIALKTLSERPSSLKKVTRSIRHRRRATTAAEHSASCDSSDNEGGEADVDSDSGYYSPKHQISRRHNVPVSATLFREDQHNVGTGAMLPQPYLNNSMSPQRVFYVHSQPSLNAQGDYYQKQPTIFPPAPPPPPSHIMQIQGSATPPLLVTQPAIRPAQARQQHGIAIANFKSRSAWEQEILKAHNVAPVISPFLGPGHQHNHAQKRHNGAMHQSKHNLRYPGPNNVRQTAPMQSYDQQRANFHETSKNGFNAKNTANHIHSNAHGILHLNPNTVPSHLRHQTPPQLTDENFPGLQPSLSVLECQGAPTSMSYSAALKNKPRTISDIHISEDSPIKNLIEIVDSGQGKGSRRRRKKTERAAKAAAEEYAEISKEQENIKKQLSKKNQARSNKGRHPQLNMAEMLSKLEQKQDLSQLNVITQEGRPQPSTRRSHIPNSPDVAPHNPLDSTAPSKKRGKEREVPKAKKPSALKKVILKEREEKKNSRVVSLSTEEKPDYDIPSLPPEIFNDEYNSLPKNETDLNNNSEAEVPASGATSSDNQSPLTVSVSGNSSPVVPLNMPKIHSRRYREYCCQVLDKQIDESCTIILQKLVQFQERMYQKDPIKAKSKRRFVLGLREVTKHLKLKKLKCVLISPNLEKIQSKGGLDDAMQNILQLCKEQSLPYVFALGRCAMGRAVSKLVPVSIIGIFDYSGVEDQYKSMLDLVAEAQRKYNEMISMYKQETPPVVPTAAKRFAHMGHSRNPSAASCVSFCSMISEPISELNPSEGTSWRNMMDVTDEMSPAPALSPPPENANEDDAPNEPLPVTDVSGDIAEEDGEVNEGEEKGFDEAADRSSSTNTDSYLNAIDNSGSLASDDKVSGDAALDKSFSTVSTVVARSSKVDPDMSKTSLVKLSLSSSGSGIPSVVEHPPPSSSDTTARINSWLEAATSSVQALGVEDPSSPHPESKLDMMQENADITQDEDEFTSANEGEDSHQE